MSVAIFGNYGVKNLGDDLILSGMLEVFCDSDIRIFCGNPKQITNNQKLSSHSFFPSGLRSWLKYLFSSAYRKQIEAGFDALKCCDRIILGGGGLLVDRRLKAVLLWFSQLRWIKKSGKPFEFLGVSFELNRWWTKRLFRPYLKAAAKITVRDTASLALLASLGIHAELVPDFAWHAPLSVISTPICHSDRPESGIGGGGVEESLGGGLRKGIPPFALMTGLSRNDTLGATLGKISLSLCRWGLGRRQQNVLRTYISERRKQGFELVGLAFQTVGDDDRKMFQNIDPSLRVVSDPNEVLNELAVSNLLIGMRYHSLVLALRLNIPFIALGYQEKVTAFMRDQGMEKRMIPIKELNDKTLLSRASHVFAVCTGVPPACRQAGRAT